MQTPINIIHSNCNSPDSGNRGGRNWLKIGDNYGVMHPLLKISGYATDYVYLAQYDLEQFFSPLIANIG